jgi:D-sedoheptulose 7-phosphate isomerase
MTMVSKYLKRVNEALLDIDEMILEAVAFYLMDFQGHVWVLGNGGSHANASHMVLHLVDNGIAAHDLMAESALYSARSNDMSYETASSVILKQVAKENDVLFVISGSGNSDNVLSALETAESLKLTTLGLLGFGGGKSAVKCNAAVVLASNDYGAIEDAHSVCVHILAAKIAEVTQYDLQLQKGHLVIG